MVRKSSRLDDTMALDKPTKAESFAIWDAL